jgi:hypothetical protein
VTTKPQEPAELSQPPPAVAKTVTAPSGSERSAPAASRPAAAAASAPAARENARAVAATQPAAPETFAFATSVVTVSEDRAAASVRIRRRGGSLGESSVVWWTGDGSALASEDYADLGMIVEEFAVGEETRTIGIPIIGDAKSEGRESFYVNLAMRGQQKDVAEVARIEIVVVDDD